MNKRLYRLLQALLLLALAVFLFSRFATGKLFWYINARFVILTFVAMISGLLGGLLVTWSALDLAPVFFLQRIVDNVGVAHFWVGMSKRRSNAGGPWEKDRRRSSAGRATDF